MGNNFGLKKNFCCWSFEPSLNNWAFGYKPAWHWLAQAKSDAWPAGLYAYITHGFS